MPFNIAQVLDLLMIVVLVMFIPIGLWRGALREWVALVQKRIDKAMFDEVWANAIPVYPKTVALERAMIDRIVNFTNETLPEPLDARVAESAWTNDFAAEALARRA